MYNIFPIDFYTQTHIIYSKKKGEKMVIWAEWNNQ